MIDAKKLLRGLLGSRSDQGKRLSAPKGAGLGVLGVALEAISHYKNKMEGVASTPPTGSLSQSGVPASVPPPPPGTARPHGGPPDLGRASAPPNPPVSGPLTGGPPAAPPSAADPAAPEIQEALLLVRAMIASAAADGMIDADERSRIIEKLESVGINADERAFIETEMAAPQEMESLVADVKDPEMARSVYAASLAAIDLDSEAERSYLRELANRLDLAADDVSAIHESVGAEKIG